jgi:hypothetical protein
MPIRTYQTGDEEAQARIYNSEARVLPAFKPSSPEEIARRYQARDFDPMSRLYAEQDGNVIGYINYNPSGRIGYPWCLPGSESARESLLTSLLATMSDRGYQCAWAAYRSDWSPILEFFKRQGFSPSREMINYVADRRGLPDRPLPADRAIEMLAPRDLPRMIALGRGLFGEVDPDRLERFLWRNPYFNADAVFALKDRHDETLLGVGLTVVNAAYADPTKLDAAMPCFRLGAFGTESERHKRIHGMFSCVFADDSAGELLLSEASRRLDQAGVSHVAAQAPSDSSSLCAFYDRYFNRQGSFPILTRKINIG